uniref:Uncharacterized protein n=1 Tax=Hyaloperonospora arabidopsidis (strain Emoy2) TaxID=559515 RepID=M4B8A6_HYAAE
MATIYWILWGLASPGPPTIRCRGVMLQRRPSSVVPAFPGGTTEGYVSHMV